MGQAPSQNESPQKKKAFAKKTFGKPQFKTPNVNLLPVQNVEQPVSIAAPQPNKEREIFNLKHSPFPQGNFGLDIKQQSPFTGHKFYQPLNTTNPVTLSIPSSSSIAPVITTQVAATPLKTQAILVNSLQKPNQNTCQFAEAPDINAPKIATNVEDPIYTKIAHNAPSVKYSSPKPASVSHDAHIESKLPPTLQLAKIESKSPPALQDANLEPNLSPPKGKIESNLSYSQDNKLESKSPQSKAKFESNARSLSKFEFSQANQTKVPAIKSESGSQQIDSGKTPAVSKIFAPKEIFNPKNGRPIRTISKKFLPDNRRIRNPNPGKINAPNLKSVKQLHKIAAAAENNLPKKTVLKQPDMTNVKAWKSFNLFLGPKEGMVDPCVFCEYNLYYKKYQIKQSRKVIK